MKTRLLRLLAPFWLAAAAGLAPGCASNTQPAQSTMGPVPAPAETGAVAQVRLALYDSARQRSVPVALYWAEPRRPGPLRAAIISHGYGGQYTGYSFLAQNLAAHGYFVASIQHELPTDEPLAMSGNIWQARYPNWARGGQNIRFVRQVLHRQYPAVDFGQLLLLGHSNGGDMSMLLAREHPELVAGVVSLDSRRVPFPRARRPRVLSLRSSDQVADAGVLPTPAEQRRYGIAIVPLPHTIHNDMWDGATAAQKREMNEAISRFLEK